MLHLSDSAKFCTNTTCSHPLAVPLHPRKFLNGDVVQGRQGRCCFCKRQEDQCCGATEVRESRRPHEQEAAPAQKIARGRVRRCRYLGLQTQKEQGGVRQSPFGVGAHGGAPTAVGNFKAKKAMDTDVKPVFELSLVWRRCSIKYVSATGHTSRGIRTAEETCQ